MKKIIAPIDFSDASVNALSFAAELSKRASAQLTVVNIQEDVDVDGKTRARLKDVVSDLKKTFGSDLDCESLLTHGRFISSLHNIIEVQNPDLIVMGTKGASGLKRILIGSNTVNVMAAIKVPVLIIPEVALFENFLRKGKNRIVLATDLTALENADALDTLKKIAMLIVEPKIRVLNVRPKNTNLDFIADTERSALISVFKPEIEAERSTVFSGNVMSGINFYLNEHTDTGMIAMIARDTGGLVQKHYTREMASHTQFPLLVLHDVKL